MKLDWENIENNQGEYINRAKIFGGWLVTVTNNVMTQVYKGYTIPENEDGYEWRTSITFVPDLNHEWKL